MCLSCRDKRHGKHQTEIIQKQGFISFAFKVACKTEVKIIHFMYLRQDKKTQMAKVAKNSEIVQLI